VGMFCAILGMVAILLALVTALVGVSRLSGLEVDGFLRGKEEWNLLEGAQSRTS